jgi:hypothetical protein
LEHTPNTENDKRKGNRCNTEQLGTRNRQNVLDPTATERCQLMASGTNKSSKAKSLSKKENNGQESAKNDKLHPCTKHQIKTANRRGKEQCL